MRGLADVDPRVVDEDVEPPAPRDGFADHRVDRLLVRHVDADGDRLGAERPELGHRGGRFLRVARGDDDACAGPGQTAGHAQSDTAVAARDDGDLAVQVERRRAGRHRYCLPWFTPIGESLLPARPYLAAIWSYVPLFCSRSSAPFTASRNCGSVLGVGIPISDSVNAVPSTT